MPPLRKNAIVHPSIRGAAGSSPAPSPRALFLPLFSTIRRSVMSWWWRNPAAALLIRPVLNDRDEPPIADASHVVSFRFFGVGPPASPFMIVAPELLASSSKRFLCANPAARRISAKSCSPGLHDLRAGKTVHRHVSVLVADTEGAPRCWSNRHTALRQMCPSLPPQCPASVYPAQPMIERWRGSLREAVRGRTSAESVLPVLCCQCLHKFANHVRKKPAFGE